MSSANNFYNYFRGLYFKVEPISSFDTGSLIQMDFNSSNAHLKLFYSYETTSTETEVTTEREGSYDLSFSGNKITLFENNFIENVNQSIIDANSYDGDQRLYLKGGQGSMAIVELFSEDENGNNFDDFITDFREIYNEGEDNEERTIKRLINEAYLEFYVDESLMDIDSDYPNRIYMYDLDNDIPLIDYLSDPTVNSISSDSKFFHLVPLTVEIDDQGNEYKKYKVRLTEHINNIIVNDFTNLRLGLLVCSNVGAANTQKLLNYDSLLKGVPSGCVLSPKGVILHGSNSIDQLKKVKLNVYYTQLNN